MDSRAVAKDMLPIRWAGKGKEKKNARPARPAPKKRETGRTETIKTTGSKRQKLGGGSSTGRLGEYRYYDMDQAIAKAFKVAKQILSQLNLQKSDIVPLKQTLAID